MKQTLNQRYVYKIKSSYLLRNKWDITMEDIQKGIKDRFIVSVGDSTGFRMIRDITNMSKIKSEDELNRIKKEIKLIRKIKTENQDEIIKNKDNIKILNNEFYKISLEENICNVVFTSESQYNYASENGFYINGEKYKLLIATTGGLKNNTAMFCRESIYDKLMSRIYNGLDKSIKMIPSKLMGYMSLIFSSSTPVTNTNNILVVKDVIKKINEDVIHIEFNDKKNIAEVTEVKNKEIEVNACDGCGLITPELAELWYKDLKLDYSPTAYCIRNSWCKGMVTKFPFKKYVKEILNKQYITDIWGDVHDIDDIDIILNESMLKCWMGYKDINEYIINCRDNGYTFSVTKVTENVLENERTMNYQYLQCLNLDDDDILNLLNKDINKIKDVLGLDYRKSILFAKGLDLNSKNVWSNSLEDDYFAKALMIDKSTINDDYIKHRIRNLISKKIKLLKTGKVNVDGNYQISIGEPIILLENMCGLEPNGLLDKGEFYIEYWRKKGVEQVGAFRSPMSCKSNARKMNICYKNNAVEWYKDLYGVIIFNAKDTTMMAMNGQDHDGDLDFTTDNYIIRKGIYDEPAIDCEGKKGEKISNITEEQFKNAIFKSFGNKVGSVTNVGSSCYDKISLFEKDSNEYKELDKRIKCIQYYQQECIDSCKNGEPPKPIPSYWNNHRDLLVKINIDEETGEILDTEDEIKIKEFNHRVLCDKKPYYFIYIYDDVYKEYCKFVKNTNISSLRRFRCTVDELKSKKYLTEEEKDFLKWYNIKNPVSCNPCIVNKIAWIVEKHFDKSKYIKNVDFNYSLYQSEFKDIADTKSKNKLIKIINEYKISKSNQCKNISTNKEDIFNEKDNRDDVLKHLVSNIIPNEQILLNTLLDLSYKKSSVPKWICWLLCGETIVSNLLKNNNNLINYPEKYQYGDFEYNGYKFIMKSKVIEREE